MKQIDIDHFEKEVTCTFKEETYSVRDNGAVFRHRREGARKRPLDEKWTFGRPSEKRGYMYISSTVVHQIVATAFHSPKPTNGYVVDHIDTNKRNNRPDFADKPGRRASFALPRFLSNLLKVPGTTCPYSEQACRINAFVPLCNQRFRKKDGLHNGVVRQLPGLIFTQQLSDRRK